MKISEAISIHTKENNWHKFPVFVWEEGAYYVTEVDGVEYRAKSEFCLDSLLSDAGVPAPRNLYLVDEPYRGGLALAARKEGK